jgi:hypothetical protein
MNLFQPDIEPDFRSGDQRHHREKAAVRPRPVPAAEPAPFPARRRFHQNAGPFGKSGSSCKRLRCPGDNRARVRPVVALVALKCTNTSPTTVREVTITGQHRNSNHYVGVLSRDLGEHGGKVWRETTDTLSVRDSVHSGLSLWQVAHRSSRSHRK